MKKTVSLFIILMVISSIGITAQEKLTFTSFTNMNYPAHGMASATNGKFIYKAGGGTYNSRDYLNNIESYVPSDDMWMTIGQNLIPRMKHNVEFVPAQNKIYIFNGEYTPTPSFNPPVKLYAIRQSKSLFTDLVEIVDLKLNTISIVDSNPYPVSNAGSAVWNDKIYFFGGWNPIGYSDRFYEYDPAKDSWEDLSDMPEAKQTTGKIADGVLYTFGGFDGDKDLNSIHAYDFKTEEWTKIGELPETVSANGIAFDGKNIWLVGSYKNPSLLIAFNTKTKTITKFESNLQGRRYGGAEVIGNYLYVFGGSNKEGERTNIAGAQRADISQYMK